MKNNKNNLISINRKIILSFSVSILIFILIFYLILNIVFKNEFEDYIYYKQQHSLAKIDLTINNTYVNNSWDNKELSEVGEELLSNGIVLEVLDKNQNKILSMLDRHREKCDEIFEDILKNMKKVKPTWKGKINSNKTPIYSDNNELIGYKTLIYYDEIFYMADEILFIYTINKILVILALVSLFSMLVITIVVSKNISDPIKRVSQTTKMIEEGNYNKLDYDGNIYELNNLIYSINKLSSSLESQENLRKQLITDLSHELSNPMTSIHGHLRALTDGIWLPTKERLNSIDQELLRVIDLIDKLKNLNKIENSNLEKKNTNLKDLVTNVINNLEASALEKQISIEYELDDLIAYIDNNKISQVIVNILSNAIKYSHEKGSIFVKLDNINNKVYISISDDGMGIPQEEIPYIFERFYRVDKLKSDDSKGLGIGLTISKHLVREHGGEILVSSEVDKGSQFTVILPMA